MAVAGQCEPSGTHILILRVDQVEVVESGHPLRLYSSVTGKTKAAAKEGADPRVRSRYRYCLLRPGGGLAGRSRARAREMGREMCRWAGHWRSSRHLLKGQGDPNHRDVITSRECGLHSPLRTIPQEADGGRTRGGLEVALERCSFPNCRRRGKDVLARVCRAAGPSRQPIQAPQCSDRVSAALCASHARTERISQAHPRRCSFRSGKGANTRHVRACHCCMQLAHAIPLNLGC